jgi:hypothetical protein
MRVPVDEAAAARWRCRTTACRTRSSAIFKTKVISLEARPKGCTEFDQGVAAKFVLDPHGLLAKAV